MRESIFSHNILDLLDSRYQTFSRGQKRTADFIRAHPQQAAQMTAGELGKSVGVSESTIVRFAFDLGYKGYPGMVQALQDSLQSKLTTVERLMVLEGLSSEEIGRISFKTDISNLKVTEELNSPVLIEAAVELMHSARRLYLVGSRSSGPLIAFLNYYLSYMMDNLHLVHFDGADIYTQMLGASGEDAMLAISFPRYSSQTISLMQYFKDLGGRTIVITDHPLSPGGLLSDYSLIARCHMNSFVDSFVAPLALINLVIIKLGLKRKNLLFSNFQQLEEDWAAHGVYSAERNDHGN